MPVQMGQFIGERAELAAGFIPLFVRRLLVAKSFLVNCFTCPKFFQSASFVTRQKA